MLIEVIGDYLPAAIAVALSPIPIVAVILVLGTPRARANGPLFAIGWVAGLVVVSVVILSVLGVTTESADDTATAADWLRVAIGAAFWLMAVKQWRGRPREGQETATPAWMARLDTLTPATALGLGGVLSGANPKNLALTMAAAASIAAAGLDDAETAIAVAVFVAIGSITVAGSVGYYLVASERAAGRLAVLERFMLAHSAVIMVVLLLLLGAKLLGDGLAGLT